MLPNLIYLGYAIALLVLDFHPYFALNSAIPLIITNESDVLIPILNQSVIKNDYANNVYIAAVNLLVAILYIMAWRGRSWFDVVLISEYLNQIPAELYIWSATWYSRQDTLGGYYTMAVHRIELTASCIELCAAVGSIVSWYMTYTRTVGRGFTLNDPDTMAYLTLVTSTLMYFVYNIQMNVYPEQYESNKLDSYANIIGFISSVYYIFGTLRDINWFWFLPLAGQYGVAIGRILVETKDVPQFAI